MTAICRNAANFQNTPRGKLPHPKSAIPADWFGYDFNTDHGGRSDKRRSRSCPSNWKNTHLCPEFDQAPIFRQDGQWWTTDIAPPTPNGVVTNYILDQPVNGGPNKRSHIRYSCDEFPPATWVEGGSDIDDSGPSETRCAAIRCPVSGIKAEQNCMSQVFPSSYSYFTKKPQEQRR